MAYTLPKNRTLLCLEWYLVRIYRHHPEYWDKGFNAMVFKFAHDPFYKAHLVAKEYLKVPVEFRL